MGVMEILAETTKQLEESMYQHNIVVRWDSGELEGFSGTALSGARKAKESAEAKAGRKAQMIKKEFKVLDGKEFAQLDSATKKRLKRDWDLSQKMDESKEIVTESKSGKEHFKYEGYDCFIRWTRYEPAKLHAKTNREYPTGTTDYSAECPELDIRTKTFETQTEAKKALITLIYTKTKYPDLHKDEEMQEESEIDSESPDFKSKEKAIAKELVASLSVFLFAVENIVGQEFESAKEAEDFIFSALRSLKTREVGTLRAMLKRFDRVGGERMANLFKRNLNRNLTK